MHSYSYDAANRLISESLLKTGLASEIRRYSYDPAGNRLTSKYLNDTTS